MSAPRGMACVKDCWPTWSLANYAHDEKKETFAVEGEKVTNIIDDIGQARTPKIQIVRLLLTLEPLLPRTCAPLHRPHPRRLHHGTIWRRGPLILLVC